MFLGTFTLKIPLINFPATCAESSSPAMETDDQSNETESSANNQSDEERSGTEIGDNGDNQGTCAMIEEIGNCEVLPEFSDTVEVGTPHLLTDKDIEEMLCALRTLPDAPTETVNTVPEMDEDLLTREKVDIGKLMSQKRELRMLRNL